jgi:hypothetical protein
MPTYAGMGSYWVVLGDATVSSVRQLLSDGRSRTTRLVYRVDDTAYA